MTTKTRYKKKLLLLLDSIERTSPWSRVLYVRGIELLGGEPDSAIRIEVRDDSQQTPHFPYMQRGPGTKHVNIPRGEIRVIRLRGTEPITVYALCHD